MMAPPSAEACALTRSSSVACEIYSGSRLNMSSPTRVDDGPSWERRRPYGGTGDGRANRLVISKCDPPKLASTDTYSSLRRDGAFGTVLEL